MSPGRYVGVAEGEEDSYVFKERLGELNEEFERLTEESRSLEDAIAANTSKLLGD